MKTISLTVNGAPAAAAVSPRTSLADFLRNERNLTGTHLGCEHGVCGACTITLNGAPARSCISFVVALDGCDVRTVEGYEEDPLMTKLRDAFHQEHALQCGFCTPGMLITARDIVSRLAAPDEKRIRTELAGNLCRCTGYLGIVNAIQRVIREVPADQRLIPAAPAAPGAAARPAFKPFTPKQVAAREPSAERTAVAAPASAEGWTAISDHFVIERPRTEVWRLLGDVAKVARCMPGADFTTTDGRELTGHLRVSFGPIKANFACTATHTRDDANMNGMLQGEGGDPRAGSRVRGRVNYRLLDASAGKATRVELSLEFQLTGPLAQFGRSGLVRDFTGRMIAAFAANLSASLSGKTVAQQASVSAGSTLAAIMWARIKRFLGL